MTEPLLPLPDEELSAYLDDEVTQEVRARIESDPQAQDRLRALRAARDSVRTTPIAPLPDDVVDSMIARALGSVDGHDAPSDDVPLAPPMSLQSRRRGGASPTTTWMVAAAVVALVAIGLGMVWSGVQSNESTDTAGTTSAADRQAARQESDSDGESADAAFESPPAASTEPAELYDLGSVNTSGELRRSLRDGIPTDSPVVGRGDAAEIEDEVPAGADDQPITVGQVDRCAQVLELQVAPGSDLVNVGSAYVDDERYLVYEFALADPTDGGDHLIVAAAPDSCAALITFIR